MTNPMLRMASALILILTFTVTSIGGPADQRELNTVFSKSLMVLEFLDTMWVDALRARQVKLTKPGLKKAADGAAFYRADDYTIYYNPEFFVERMRDAAAKTGTDGDMAFLVILAHEYGHSIQHQLGLSSDCMASELQADRMAGAFAAVALQKGLLDAGDLDEATYTFFTGRDETHGAAACPHGTGTQRVNAFHIGLSGGTAAALR